MSDQAHVAIDVSQIQMILPERVKSVYPRNMVVGRRYKIVFGKSMNEFYGTLVKYDTNGLIYFNEVSYARYMGKEWKGPDSLSLYTANYIFYPI